MRKVLRANFARFWTNKSLYIFCAVMCVQGIVIPIMDRWVVVKRGEDIPLEENFFGYAVFAMIFVSVWTALFVGTEYRDGTIRNKIVVGRHRWEVYLANLAVSAVAGVLMCAAYILPYLCVGVPLLGRFTCEVGPLLLNVLVSLLAVAAVGAIITMTSMLIASRSSAVVAAFFLTFSLLLLASFFYNGLCEPETTYGSVTISTDGVEFGDVIPNPAYVDGTARKVYQAALNLLPTGQAVLITERADAASGYAVPALEFAGSLLVFAAASAVGLAAFRKKDLK